MDEISLLKNENKNVLKVTKKCSHLFLLLLFIIIIIIIILYILYKYIYIYNIKIIQNKQKIREKIEKIEK